MNMISYIKPYPIFNILDLLHIKSRPIHLTPKTGSASSVFQAVEGSYLSCSCVSMKAIQNIEQAHDVRMNDGDRGGFDGAMTLALIDPEVFVHQSDNSPRHLECGKRQAMALNLRSRPLLNYAPFCPLLSSLSLLEVRPAPFEAAPRLAYSPPSGIARLLAVYVCLVSPECLARFFRQLCAGLSPSGVVLSTYPPVNRRRKEKPCLRGNQDEVRSGEGHAAQLCIFRP